jgi:hypothetical protein
MGFAMPDQSKRPDRLFTSCNQRDLTLYSSARPFIHPPPRTLLDLTLYSSALTLYSSAYRHTIDSTIPLKPTK